MHTININDLDKISTNVFNKISIISKPTLTSIKEAIIQSFGYKNLYAFQQTNKKEDVGLLKYFTPQEIVYIVGLDITMNNYYDNFENLISDILLKFSSLEKAASDFYKAKIDFLRFLNKNNFTFFNYRWFKESASTNSKGGTMKSYTSMEYLTLWNSIEKLIPLSCISIYNSIVYKQYFFEKQAIENKSVYTIYDFIKSFFISIKKNSFFNTAFSILTKHYTLLNSISELMDNIYVTDYDYISFRETEKYDHYLIFKEEHLNRMAKSLNKGEFSISKIENIFENLFKPQEKIDIIAPDYAFVGLSSFGYFLSMGSTSKDIREKNLERNILLANKDIFRYQIKDILFNDRVFKNRTIGEYYKLTVIDSFINKAHFHNSWLSYDKFLYIYIHFYVLTNKNMHMNDFIYFCKNFITDPDLIDYHREVVPDILLNQYSSFLSDSLFN